MAVIEVVPLGYILFGAPTSIKPNEELAAVYWPVVSFRILFLGGAIGSLLSIWRKEASVFRKWTAAMVHFLLICFVVSVIVYAHFCGSFDSQTLVKNKE